MQKNRRMTTTKKIIVILGTIAFLIGGIIFLTKTNAKPKTESKQRKLTDGDKMLARSDYSKGVLAVNLEKNVVPINQKISIQLSSLDNKGQTLCDSNLEVTVTRQEDNSSTTMNIANGGIGKSSSCSPDNNVTNEADYITFYTPTQAGTYHVQLTDTDTKLSVSNEFIVPNESPVLDVKRWSATRINPSKSSRYPMVITVTAIKDYKGKFQEFLPRNFELAWQGPANVTKDDNNTVVTWDLDLTAGQQKELKYEYSAPVVSPYFYKLHSSEEFNSEWQIASDLTATYDFNTCTTGTNCFAWTTDLDTWDTTTAPPIDSDWNAWTTQATYSAILSSNDVRYATVNPGVGDFAPLLMQFNITQNRNSISQIAISVEGRSNETSSGTAILKACNTASNSLTLQKCNSWSTSSSTAVNNSSGADTTATLTLSSSITNYVNSSGNFYFAYGLSTSNTEIQIDMVTVTVTYTPVITGNAYADEATTAWVPCDGSTANISLVINGGAAATTSCADADGAFTFTGQSWSATNPISVFFNATDKGVAVTIAVDGTTNFTINPRKNIVWVGGASPTNTTLDHCDSGVTGCSNIPYVVTTSNLTVDSGVELHVGSFTTYSPGGNITTQGTGTVHLDDNSLLTGASTQVYSIANQLLIDTGSIFTAPTSGSVTAASLTLVGTFTAGGTTFTLNGTSGTLFTNSSGTFTANSSTLVFNPNASITLFSSPPTVNNLSLTPTLSSTGKTYTVGGALTINGDFNINPTAASSLALTVNMGGNITVDATKTTTITGTTSGTSVLDTRPSSTDYNLSSGFINLASAGTIDCTSSSSTITLTATSGTLFTNPGTFTEGTSTIIFNPNASVTLFSATDTIYNLSLTPTLSSSGKSYDVGAILTMNGDFTINPTAASSLALTVNMGGNITVASTKTTTITGTTSGTSTLDVRPSSTDYTLSTGLINIASAGTFDGTSSTGTILTLTGTSGTLFTRVGTFTPGTGTVTIDNSGTPTLNSGTITFSGLSLTSSTSYAAASSDDLTVTATLSITGSANLVLNTGQDLTHSGSTLTLNGTLSGAGRYIYQSATTFPTTGTISCVLRMDSTSNDQSLGARTYGGDVEIYNNSAASARTVTLGTAGSQTLNFSANVYLIADNTQNITLSGTSNNPTINITGNLDYTGVGAGTELLFTGTGTWTVSGNIDLTGGTTTFTATNTLKMNGSTKTLTSASRSLYNFEVSAGLITIQDTLDIDGNLTISGGTLDVKSGGNFQINLAGNWSNNGGIFVERTGKVVFDGAASATVDSGCTAVGSCTDKNFYDMEINKTDASDANDNVTLTATDLWVSNNFTISDGEFIQGVYNVEVDGSSSVSVSANGQWTNISTGDLTLGGSFDNSGIVTFQGNGEACGDADGILLASNDVAARAWTGSGTFNINDATITSLSGTASITAFSSTDGGGNGANWTITSSCGGGGGSTNPVETTINGNIEFNGIDFN